MNEIKQRIVVLRQQLVWKGGKPAATTDLLVFLNTIAVSFLERLITAMFRLGGTLIKYCSMK